MGFHVNKKGDSRACSAKIKCPFLPVDLHFPTSEKAREFYENFAKFIPSSENFNDEMNEVVSTLVNDYGELVVPNASPAGNPLKFGTFVQRKIKKAYFDVTGESLIEEEIAMYSRNVMQDMTTSVDDPKFWGEYFDKVVSYAIIKPERGGKVKFDEEVNDESTKTAYTLSNLINRNVAGGSIVDYLDPKNKQNRPFIAALKEDGFSFVGEGAESVVFYHAPSNSVWKTAGYLETSAYRESSGEAYVKNTLVGRDTFPKMNRIRHAETKGFMLNKVGLISQEVLDKPNVNAAKECTQSELIQLSLSGHTDTRLNIGKDAQGNLVAFDTLGLYWEDVDDFVVA